MAKLIKDSEERQMNFLSNLIEQQRKSDAEERERDRNLLIQIVGHVLLKKNDYKKYLQKHKLTMCSVVFFNVIHKWVSCMNSIVIIMMTLNIISSVIILLHYIIQHSVLIQATTELANVMKYYAANNYVTCIFKLRM